MRGILSRAFYCAAIAGFISLFHLCATAEENVDPYNDASQYVYGENIGWLNAEPLGDGGPGVDVTDTMLSGYVWAENIGWVSLSCENTSSCGTVSYGITNDQTGQLSGYAWSENAGWISFSCTNTDSCTTVDYGVTIDTITGEFHGRAWGENIGWISFRGEDSAPFRVMTSWEPSAVNECGVDLDEDGDVDGLDLAVLITGFENDSLIEFAIEFGRTECYD